MTDKTRPTATRKTEPARANALHIYFESIDGLITVDRTNFSGEPDAVSDALDAVQTWLNEQRAR